MDRSTVRTLVLVGFVMGAAGVVAASFANPAPVDGGVPLAAPNGLVVTLDGNTSADLGDFTDGSDTVVIETVDGNVTVSSGGAADATIHKDDITGTWTNVTGINAGFTQITIDPEDKTAATVGGDISSVAFRDASGVAADDGVVDFVYAGPSGTSNVTIQGAPASTTLGAVDADNGTLLDVADSDSTGEVTFDELDNSEHSVEVQTGDAPTVSNAQPTGDLSNPPSELSVDINDSDFNDGDNVSVEFTLDGSVVGTKYATSNGTVSQAISNPDGGSHDWSVDVADEYGNTVNKSYSFRVPTELTVRDELPQHAIISPTDVDGELQATCYEDADTNPAIIQRTTTNGKIDLTGFPTGSEFSCQLSAAGYHNRTILLDSLYDQSTAFMIKKADATTVENRFVVNDRSGKFPPEETEIIIQRGINQSLYGSGGYDWLSVSGDDLGADEAYVDDLQEENRYRIIVENDDGDQRNLGAYTPEVSGTIELNIGEVNGSTVDSDGVAFGAQYINTTTGKEIKVEYNDTANATDTLYLNIYERNNESNTLVDNESFSGPYGTFAHTEPVPEAFNETTWVVEVTGVRGVGDDGEDRTNVQFQYYAGPGFNVLNSLPAWLVTVIFTGMILAVTGLFSQVNGHVGGLVVASLGAMFYFVGLVPGYLGGGVVALSLLTAGMLFIRGARGGGL